MWYNNGQTTPRTTRQDHKQRLKQGREVGRFRIRYIRMRGRTMPRLVMALRLCWLAAAARETHPLEVYGAAKAFWAIWYLGS